MAKKITIGALFLLALFIVGAWTYSLGLSDGHSFEAVKFMVLVKRQHECIESSDVHCASKINEIMAHVTASHLRRTDSSGLSQSDRKGIEEFLQWESKLGISSQ